MNKILVMTDFSVNAAYAAGYAFKLASHLQLDILLCHYTYASRLETAGHGNDQPEDVSPERETAIVQQLIASSNSIYKQRETVPSGNYLPKVNYHYHKGGFDSELSGYESGGEIQLVVAGTHDAADAKKTEDHVNELIELLPYPLLIIPPGTEFKPFKKILFATKLQEDEVPLLRHLTTLVKPFRAEVVLTHICSASKIHAVLAQRFMADVSHTIPYTHITYSETLQNKPFDIQKIGKERQFDLLVVVHRDHFPSTLSTLLASVTTMPLLVYKQPGMM